MAQLHGFLKRHPYFALQATGWGALATAAVIPALARDPSAAAAVLATLLLTALGLSCSLLLAAVFRRLDGRTSDRHLLAITAGVCYVCGNAWSVAERIGREAIHDGLQGRAFDLPQSRVLFHNGLFFSFILLSWSLLYLTVRRYGLLEIQRQRALEAENASRQAEVRALRFQMNPHFLLNALNGVSTLVTEGRGSDATAMLARLGEYLRVILSVPGTATNTFGTEVAYVRQYLEIERFRFSDRLRLEFDVDPAAASVPVPALILQPLVENAVKHGIARLVDGGLISLRARVSDGMLVIRLENDVAAGTPPGEGELRIGLANTAARLRGAYGERSSLAVSPTAASFQVTLSVPEEGPATGPEAPE